MPGSSSTSSSFSKTVTTANSSTHPTPAASLSPTLTFSTAASTITAGSSTTLTVNTNAPLTGITNVTLPSNLKNLVGSGTLTVSPSVTTIYVATATNSSGQTSSQSVTVTVEAAPAITAFTAASSSITAGASTTLNWATNATGTITIAASGGATTTNPATGSLSVTPSQTTTYTLTVKNSLGVAAVKSLTVTVTAPVVGAAVITSFSASSASITAGASTILSWATTGASSVAISGVSAVLSTSGNTSVTPSQTTTYTLTATNSAGASVTQTVTVTVSAIPVITSFSAASTKVTAGASTTLSWTTTGASSVTITGVSSTLATSGSVPVSPSQTTTYTLTATNAAATAVTQTVTVSVTPLPVITSFTATPTTITAGGSSYLFWSGTNVTTFSVNGAAQTVVGLNVTPTTTTTYTLVATNSTGQTATQSLTITVNPPASPPAINSFSAVATTIAPGSAVTLNWSVSNASAVTLYGGPAGTTQFPGTSTGTQITLTCSGAPSCGYYFNIVATGTGQPATSQSIMISVIPPVVVPATVDHLAFTTLPQNILLTQSQSFAVTAYDSSNNPIPSTTLVVNFSGIAATPYGWDVQTNAQGIYQETDPAIGANNTSLIGQTVKITASAYSNSSISVSASYTYLPQPSSSIRFGQQIAGSYIAGKVVGPATILGVDANNNITSIPDGTTATMTLIQNTTGGLILGNTAVASGGQLTFNNVTIQTAGTYIAKVTLDATPNISVSTNSFTITPDITGAVTSVVTAPPSNILSGTSFSVGFSVVDEFGNSIAGSSTYLMLGNPTITSGPNGATINLVSSSMNGNTLNGSMTITNPASIVTNGTYQVTVPIQYTTPTNENQTTLSSSSFNITADYSPVAQPVQISQITADTAIFPGSPVSSFVDHSDVYDNYSNTASTPGVAIVNGALYNFTPAFGSNGAFTPYQATLGTGAVSFPAGAGMRKVLTTPYFSPLGSPGNFYSNTYGVCALYNDQTVRCLGETQYSTTGLNVVLNTPTYLYPTNVIASNVSDIVALRVPAPCGAGYSYTCSQNYSPTLVYVDTQNNVHWVDFQNRFGAFSLTAAAGSVVSTSIGQYGTGYALTGVPDDVFITACVAQNGYSCQTVSTTSPSSLPSVGGIAGLPGNVAAITALAPIPGANTLYTPAAQVIGSPTAQQILMGYAILTNGDLYVLTSPGPNSFLATGPIAQNIAKLDDAGLDHATVSFTTVLRSDGAVEAIHLPVPNPIQGQVYDFLTINASTSIYAVISALTDSGDATDISGSCFLSPQGGITCTNAASAAGCKYSRSMCTY